MVRVIGFDLAYREAFRDLNEEWLNRYFKVEPIDQKVLADPEAHIIAGGGEIFFAIDAAGVALGTCALKPAANFGMELTKMAVTQSAQGRGIGRLLMDAVLAYWSAGPAGELFLESHSSLTTALALYVSAGFEHQPCPFSSEYARSDVYMVWRAPAR